MSKFFLTRIDNVSRKFIQNAEMPDYRLRSIVGGHTDIIGEEEHNQELANERAQREYDNIKRYIKFIKGFTGDEWFERWLVQNDASIEFQGNGSTQPYEIEKKLTDEKGTIRIGNNELPEGRIVNRRVVIEYIMAPKN
jgi:outer membrane protein OmpA-like peptidoglycan-associated protein